jgi:ribosomal protein L40E
MNRRYQVFVSSTYEDLKEERFQVLKALLELDCIPCGMEYFPAASEDQWTYIRELIAECDYYLLIIGGRYGSTDEDGVSYTEKEYDFAVAQGIPTIAFIHGDPASRLARQVEATEEGREKLRAFTDKVRRKLCKHWNTPGELEAVVSRGITQLIRRKPRPGWVRADAAADVPAEIETLRDQLRRLVTVVDHLRGADAEPDAGGVAPSVPSTPPGTEPAPSTDHATAEPAVPPPPAALSDDDLAFLEELDRAISATPAPDRSAGEQAEPKPASAAPKPPDDPVDLAFLDELDRAIRGSDWEKNPDVPGASNEPAPAEVVCTECGALNEPGSWYCEICGSALEEPEPESAPAPAVSATPAPVHASAPALAATPAGESLLCKECGAINEPGSWYCEICGSEH